MTQKPSVALIGAGAMGGALLKGWIAGGSIAARDSSVFDPALSQDVKALALESDVVLNSTSERFDAVVIAVKPQVADDVLPRYASLAKNKLVISVMAGKSIASISSALGGVPTIVRAMPNLASAVGKGVSGLYAPNAVDAKGRRLAETLMRAAGDVVWVRTEQEIDFVTAVSGSGPAYYFLLTEALAEAGEALGLDKEAAAALARATLTGSGALIAAGARTPAEMRRAVTSPGGTTEAALKIFDGGDKALRELVRKAIAAAAKRAGELTD